MKKYFIYHIAAFIALSACSNKLDVYPDTQIAPDQVTKNNLPLLVNGAKLGLTNNAFYGYFVLPDVMSDDVQTLGLAGYEACNIPVTDNTLTFAYRYPYQCIANANSAINFGEKNLDDAIRPAVGEAYLLRAYAYMLLSDQFGDVGIMLGGENPLSLPERKPVAEVEALIIADLNKAIGYLPDFAGKTLVASKQAAQLLLARLYLNTGKHADAKQLAEAVIASGKFTLEAGKYADMFKYNTSSREMVYAIGETSTSGSNAYGLPNAYGPGGTGQAGSGNTWIDSNMVKSYEDGDVRKTAYLKKKAPNLVNEVYYLMKFPMEITPAYPVCRYSEAYLIVAEAAARAGAVDVTAYNALRSKRGASTRLNSQFATPQDFLNEIEQERRREFTGERMRWNDMRRFGKAVPYLTGLRQPAGHVLMPVPDRMLTLNPNIRQNKDY
ncbi:RagB/SusD family nutrient uptake outer membrane protein [Chitinophaga lutea]|uniref:RagB/SusD family nutrient uptake outer membrane protein n=1 Tax=Chitinophaga lutea TaxID=2488634 RepID=A0A3N4PLQ8_9BACT|nr:RagB/SusD family nutrient uptake outer membrane protein [Chitinophaga lutea]RPE08735.1 RagB/SusD family nutrient uptake outer membrane protein [Chitinophaga lutea]